MPHPNPVMVPADADLLTRFLADRTEAAFAAIVDRHGPLVLRVCRQVLGPTADADDAFQLTFLVLAERATSVRHRASLGSWLFGVADRVARKARRRNMRSGPVPETTAMIPDPADAVAQQETQHVVDEELARLPDRYRDPLVLCYLDGLTTEQAAGRARCPHGTFKSRLAKARELLRSRLVRRGVALSAVGLVAVLSEGRASAVPPALAARTTHRAIAVRPSTGPGIWGTSALAIGAVIALAVGLLVGLGRSGGPPEPGGGPADGPLQLRIGQASAPIAAGGAGGGTLVVVNQVESTASLIDVRSGTVKKTVKTGAGPHEAAASPNGKRVAVSNYGPPAVKGHGKTVTIIGLPRGDVESTIDLGELIAPHGLAWLDDDRLLCTCEAAQKVAVVDVKSGKVAGTIATDQEGSHMVALAAGGKRAYTANVMSGTVTALDVPGGKKLRDIDVGKGIEGLGVSPDGKRLWALNRAKNEAAVIDAEGLKVATTFATPKLPFRVTFTPDGSTALVACPMDSVLVLYDARTLKERARVSFAKGKIEFDSPGPPPGPMAVAVRPDGKVAYATVHVSGAVAIIDLAKGEVTGKIAVGKGPDGIAFSPVSLE